MSDHTRPRDRVDPDARGMFAVECPGCRAHVAVARDLVGRAAGCPGCRGAFLVPVPGVSMPRPAARLRTPAAPGREAAIVQPVRTAVEPARPSAHDEPMTFVDPPLPSTRHRVATSPLPGPPAATPEIGTGAPQDATSEAVVPTGPDEAATLAFREPVKTVRSGGAEIELRRLTPEEKRTRRARRNLLILVVGAALLVALVVILGKGGGPHPRP